jgi:hypothetical protein
VRLLRNPDGKDVRALVQISKAYQIEPAGEAIEVWRILPGQPQHIALPVAGKSVAVSSGASIDKFIAVLLEDDSVLMQDSVQVIPAATPNYGKSGVGNFPALFALSHDARFAVNANGNLRGVQVRDLRAGGREPLLEDGGKWNQPGRMQGPVTAVAWSPVSPMLLFTSSDGGFAVIKFRDQRPAVAWFELDRHFTAAGFSPDGEVALALSDGKAVIRREPAFSDEKKDLETGLDHVEALAVGKKIVAAAGDGRLAIIKRDDGSRVGTWKLPPGRVDAIALVAAEVSQTNQESAVTVLVRDQLVVIHAVTGIELLVADAESVRGRKHAAIGIERQLALLWSSDRRGIDLHAMDRGEARLTP